MSLLRDYWTKVVLMNCYGLIIPKKDYQGLKVLNLHLFDVLCSKYRSLLTCHPFGTFSPCVNPSPYPLSVTFVPLFHIHMTKHHPNTYFQRHFTLNLNNVVTRIIIYNNIQLQCALNRV